MSTVSVKISELSGAALDWAVAKCEGLLDQWGVCAPVGFEPSTDWSQGGLIIERENITIIRADDDYEKDDQSPSGLRSIPAWFAECDQRVGHSLYISYEVESMEPAFIIEEGWGYYGPTPLIAAMRCYVASKTKGNSVMIPRELINE